MKSGKAVGPDDILEVWKCLGEAAVEFLTSLFNRVLESQTEEFKVEVGLHQGSALSPFLFAMVMDQLSQEVRQESPWTMMFADDSESSESREQVEENLERWRFALERRGMIFQLLRMSNNSGADVFSYIAFKLCNCIPENITNTTQYLYIIKKKNSKGKPEGDDKVKTNNTERKFLDDIKELQTVKSSPYLSEDGLKESNVEVFGRGSYGKVVLAELKGTDKVFAVKMLKRNRIKSYKKVHQTLVERCVLVLTKEHPFLTQVCCCFQTNDCLYFAMEYMNGGDLVYHTAQSFRCTKSRSHFYAAEIASAVMFLHRNGIIHRDLKPSNILLGADGHCKVADFGIRKEGILDVKTTHTICGTPLYMALEILLKRKYGASVDWWCLGVIMMVRYCLFVAKNKARLYKSILRDSPSYPFWLSREERRILKAFLVKCPENRLGCVVSQGQEEAITFHPFFKKIDWVLLEQRKITPPFKPKIAAKRDANNFKACFTHQKLRLTPTDDSKIRSFYQRFFDDFSHCNSNID
ncbi:hypothetical protein QTP86_012554 [Hemibagrus guttatus]|nr:hypothetical protein QTP86_012554 [Hemibagrus guttatus]